MSDLGSLSECLVDNDPAARVRARRLRSKALVLSVALEALILAALFLWPLISPGVLTAHYIVTPAPPYSGAGGARSSRSEPFSLIHRIAYAGDLSRRLRSGGSSVGAREWFGGAGHWPGPGRRKRRSGPAGLRAKFPRRNGRPHYRPRTAARRAASRSNNTGERRGNGGDDSEPSGAAISGQRQSGAHFRHRASARHHWERMAACARWKWWTEIRCLREQHCSRCKLGATGQRG